MNHAELEPGGVLCVLSHPAPPPWLHDRIVAMIRAEASRQHRRHLRHVILGLAALLSLIVMAHGLVH